jgi:hypothetical protein
VAASVPEIIDIPEKLENNSRIALALIAVIFFTNSACNM